MQLSYYHVDAFADRVFTGNPAAVYILDEWLDDQLLQALAAEHNLAETAFCVACLNHYELRWFTPLVEVDLCGHATLATAYVLFTQNLTSHSQLRFKTRSGELLVTRQGEQISMNFPAEQAPQCDLPSGLCTALGMQVENVYFNVDYLVPIGSEAQLSALKPDFGLLAELPARGVIVTAASQRYDFVCRFFAPNVGINEDPVTGSAFTKLIPYWSRKLAKTSLRAKQLSARGGEVACELQGDRVEIGGSAVMFSKGLIKL